MSTGRNPNLRTFSFPVDVTNPKYDKLIEFLDSVDPGNRSCKIREYLTEYIELKSQLSVEGIAGLVQNVQSIQTQVSVNPLSAEEQNPQTPDLDPQEIKQQNMQKNKKLNNLRRQFG